MAQRNTVSKQGIYTVCERDLYDVGIDETQQDQNEPKKGPHVEKSHHYVKAIQGRKYGIGLQDLVLYPREELQQRKNNN